MGNQRQFLRSLVLAAFLGWSLIAPVQARVSQEGVLAWSGFSMESSGIGSSGPVSVSGKQDPTGVTALTIKAFGRTYVLDKDHLQKLKAMMMNGMQLSYEGGYKDLGGRTLYLQVSPGFTSGVVLRKVIVVKERGDVAVQELPSK
jgi:hypothetical protein